MPDPFPPQDHAATAARQHWMAVLARADAGTLRAALAAHAGAPDWQRLRGPEAGMVMLRGRQGGGGGPFNLGEATTCRCTIRLSAGTVGHAYVLGRDAAHAELAAVFDALLQDPERGPALTRAVIAPLAKTQAEMGAGVAQRAAATRVEFFTMALMRAGTN